jgi:hypothetical protein
MNVETPTTVPVETNNFFTEHAKLMANSFEQLLGRPLLALNSAVVVNLIIRHGVIILEKQATLIFCIVLCESENPIPLFQ